MEKLLHSPADKKFVYDGESIYLNLIHTSELMIT